jgi:LacI family transcriptional regulator
MKRVALLMETSLEVSREILAGIIDYCKAHEPWQLDFTPGGVGDQVLPRGWEGDGIIVRVPSAKEAGRLAAQPVPKILFDPLDSFVAPGQPLARCVRVENDHRAVGRLAADYFLERGFRHFAYCPASLSSAPQIRYAIRDAGEEPNWSRLRREGFVKRLAESGCDAAICPCAESRGLSECWHLERPHVVKWLQSLPRPLAIFAPNDARGRQVVDACQTAGVSVPYAAAVLAVNDDTTLCETCLPPLSSIRLDAHRAGALAAAALDALMNGRVPAHRRILYAPAKVVTRDSTRQMQTDDALVISVLERIREANGFSLRAEELAASAHVSLKTLERRFRAAIGRSVGAVVRATCLDRVRTLVETTDLPFAEITRQAGQLSASHLAAAFRARFGQTMTAARQSAGK